MKRLAFWVSLLAIFSFAFGSPGFAASKTIKWRMQCAYPPGDSTFEIHSKETIKRLENASNGTLKIELFSPGALCSVKEMVNAVSQGMIEMANIYGPRYAGSVPVADVEGGLPFTWTSMDQVVELFWGKPYRLIDVIRSGWEKKNIFYLVPCGCGSYPFQFNFPMEKIDDLKGHKIRGMGATGEWLRLAGASPVVLPGGEIYMAMKLGTIDGTPFPPMILETLKLKEVVKYVIFPGLVIPPQTCMIVNQDAWKALPENVRNSVLDEKTLPEFYLRNAKAYQQTDETALKAAQEIGVKIIHLPEEETIKGRRIAVEVWDKIGKKNKFSGQAVEILKTYMRDKNML
jgi:TRAP-type C4-dicarboxylate transport system substrate-binding protein